MDKKKIVILGLIVLAVLFFTGIGAGLAPKERQPKSKEKDKQKDEYIAGQKEGGGWEQSLGRLMAPFAPPLDVPRLLRLTSPIECKIAEKLIELSKSKKSCVIDIPKFPPSDDEDYRKAKISLMEQGPRVTVAYKPRGKEEADHPLTFEEPIDLVVLKKGGLLTISCSDDCFKSRERPVKVKFE
jgi:hypothetical protein